MKVKGKWSTGEIWIDGVLLRPEASQKVRNHSPDGFNWGYGGSGPAQLALAIMLTIYPKERALDCYQTFKWDEVARWPKGDFERDVSFEPKPLTEISL